MIPKYSLSKKPRKGKVKAKKPKTLEELSLQCATKKNAVLHSLHVVKKEW